MGEIVNPRRILAVSLAQDEELLRKFITDLTGTAPEPGSPLAGETVKFDMTTKYYKAVIPVWLDTIATTSEWVATFLEPEAQEVLRAVGGFMVVFPVPSKGGSTAELRELLEQMKRLMDLGFGDQSWDGVGLAVGVGGDADEGDVEGLCNHVCGWALEYIHVGNNVSSEDEDGFKAGMSRVHEALQANDWEQAVDPSEANSDDSFQDFELPKAPGTDLDMSKLDSQELDFGVHGDIMQELKKAILSTQGDDDAPVGPRADDSAVVEGEASKGNVHSHADLDADEIAKLEGMMRRLKAARDAGAEMSDAKRRQMAADAVAEIMRDL
ncbi:hypothetical protein HIM_06646 [Hirsutella minnesotensis 3608]|uniref:Increased recombination centers protein 6 n=1 Tax=Hirsutella minnesotensis 3608 TaxID=1043627 RepID=A0A0F7ZTZ6_9HYPO|nr:hypothetical protein HIM_06646 [Hirsutella minnesotensis 3608]